MLHWQQADIIGISIWQYTGNSFSFSGWRAPAPKIIMSSVETTWDSCNVAVRGCYRTKTTYCRFFIVLDSGDACNEEDSSLQTFVAVKDATTLPGVLESCCCDTPIGRPTIRGGQDLGCHIICLKIQRPLYASQGRRGQCSRLVGCKNWVARLLLSCCWRMSPLWPLLERMCASSLNFVIGGVAIADPCGWAWNESLSWFTIVWNYGVCSPDKAWKILWRIARTKGAHYPDEIWTSLYNNTIESTTPRTQTRKQCIFVSGFCTFKSTKKQ